jgi:hypothetical protein
MRLLRFIFAEHLEQGNGHQIAETYLALQFDGLSSPGGKGEGVE